MAVVNTNIGASLAQAGLMRNERALGTAMEHSPPAKKSTQQAITRRIGDLRMTAQIKGLDTPSETLVMRSAWSIPLKVPSMRSPQCSSVCGNSRFKPERAQPIPRIVRISTQNL